ncbi:uncharacterized protein B0I36DRAFT_251281 [Microdochium trichocladiopsis]|uniref:Short-chain dehydrogenase n=1 Tax=Microdochium trichocladiopsis TaxID=1682393 RepID=A0A9P8Y1L5_9PEZI|nr:uncharacterized protein B0I36DRAFT_251281 [Microdochium trichocladiopsis]KAH7025147.1 hypothetical protein B0I36DRAFT_251281 [Microdochium trichocladiopsis]
MSFKSPSPFPLQGRYADGNRWETLRGPGDARPTALQIIKDEGLVSSLADKVIFVTGASSGMGPYMVRALAATGATIYVGARDIDKAKEAIGEDLIASNDDINGNDNGSGRVHILHLDQADLSSVRACVAEFIKHVASSSSAQGKQKGPQLNILINNAGVMRTPEQRTKDGYELQFATNHLSHFLLFWLLKDIMLASATPEFPSRVVNTTSAGHKAAPLDLEALNPEKEGAYDPWIAYIQSKISNIYMASQITRLHGNQNLYGFSATPGSFVSPNLQQHCTPEELSGWKSDPRLAVSYYNYEQACATAVYGALAQEPINFVKAQNRGKGEASTGLYLEGSAVAGPVPKDAVDLLEYGHAEWAFDADKEAKLWNLSKKLVGVEQTIGTVDEVSM